MTTCKATQHSDQMMCPCGLAWDVNDPEPPTCKTTGQQARASGKAIDPYHESVALLDYEHQDPAGANAIQFAQKQRVQHLPPSDQAQQERRVAPRTSSLSAEAAHGRLSRLSALLRSSPVASASNAKIGTVAHVPELDYAGLLIYGEVVNVSAELYHKAINPPGRMVVCAAVSVQTDEGCRVVIGPRHFDETMQQQFKDALLVADVKHNPPAQGFIDQWGVFMTREQALVVAHRAGQLGRRPKGRPFNQLFSEDLY